MDSSPQSAVEGSPLISPDLVIFYFSIFLIVTTIIYLVHHFTTKPQNPSHIKKFLITALIVKVFFVFLIFTAVLYYFIPSPKISNSSPAANSSEVPISSKIEITFDRPVSRSELAKQISPKIPGTWRFEISYYKTHLYRKLVFYPEVTLLPDVEYTIILKNVKNVSKLSQSNNFSLTFKTEPLPNVSSISPQAGSNDVSLDSPISIELDRPNKNLADFSFVLEPHIDHSVEVSKDYKSYIIKPKERLKQGTEYSLKVAKARIAKDKEGAIVFRGTQQSESSTKFKTKLPPRIASFIRNAEQAFVDAPLNIEFTKAMDFKSVQENISVEPAFAGTIVLSEDKKLSIIPKKLEFETPYEIKIAKGTKSIDGTYTEEDIVLDFKTIGSVKIVSASSVWENQNENIGVKNSLSFNFDQEVDKISAQNNFSITPQVDGTFTWNGNTMIFAPSHLLAYDTKYMTVFAPGIKSIRGLVSRDFFTTSFSTESFVFILSVPAYLQKYPLSCEAASLRMILIFKGIPINEDQILELIGFDNTPKQDGIWGDPNAAFVGNVKGKQMVSGYGVHWGPIERVAKIYRNAQSFSGWSLGQLTDQLLKGNPVQVWGYSRGGVASFWNTPGGNQIQAIAGEHTMVVKGFAGKADDPSQIIVNDPLVGEVYLSQSMFNTKWEAFGRSGVVVF